MQSNIKKYSRLENLEYLENLVGIFCCMRSESILKELKEELKNHEIITVQKRTLVVITITAKSEQKYSGKKYIREGSDIKEEFD